MKLILIESLLYENINSVHLTYATAPLKIAFQSDNYAVKLITAAGKCWSKMINLNCRLLHRDCAHNGTL